MSSSAAAPSNSPWLFGRAVDLSLGYGLAYLVSVPLLALGFATGTFTGGPVWGVLALAIVFSTPHYGATLLRVYDRRQDRQRYAIFAVWITIALVGLFAAGLWNPWVGSLLLTAYVSWSPWHFSGQNYGLAVMYLRRAGIPFTPETKRDLYVSFILSAAIAILAVHLAGSNLRFANQSADTAAIFSVIQLGVPAQVAQGIAALAMVAYGFFLFRVARSLLPVSTLGALLPVTLLVGTQALWFAVPGLAATLASETGIPAGLALPLSAVWISTAHAIQYLWVTCYYAQQTGETGSTPPFLLRSLLAGAFLSAPSLLLFPGTFGDVFPNAAGAAVLIFSVVNLHHFILDGAIWKLRDGKVARALLRASDGDDASGTNGGRPWLRPVVVSIGALCLLVQVYGAWLASVASAPETGIAALRSASAQLGWLGKDTPSLWARLGQLSREEGDADTAIAAYRRSIRQDPAPPAWLADQLARLLLVERAKEPKSVAQAQRLAIYVTRSAPDRPEGYMTLALAREAAGDWNTAAAAARQGLSLAREQGDADRALAFERRLGKYSRRASLPAGETPRTTP